MINSFTGLHAGHYDLVYADKPYPDEARFVTARLEQALGKRPGSLLDLACGTGRHAAEFAQMGMEVTGVDINDELLEQARARSPEIRFLVGDMTELDLGGRRFDAVTCLFDSIGYPRHNAPVIATLAGARRHLVPGGVLAVEFLHAPAMVLHATPLRIRRWDPGEGDELIRLSTTRLDSERQLMEVEYELIELRSDGTYSRWRERQANRFFSVPEMGVLFGAAGLEPVEFTAAYRQDGRIDDETFHVLGLARAPEER